MALARPAALFALMLFALPGCKKSAGEEPEAPPAEAVKNGDEPVLALEVVGDVVVKQDLLQAVNATGQIKSEAIANVKSETGGTVQEVLVAPGAKVSKGQILARLETKLLDMDVAQAKANLATATMNFTNSLLEDSLERRLPTPARREMLRAQSGIDNAQVNLERSQYQREHAVITAPYDGIIERVGVVVGDRIGSGAEIAQIVDLMHLRIDAQVMEHDLPALLVGAEAEITIGAVAGDPVHGKISAILPLVDSVLKFGRASIRFPGNGVIHPGMFASVRLEAKRLPGQILVPVAAVVERQGRPLVFVVHNGIAEWVYIRPGPRNDRQIAILPDSATGIIPLSPGDTILVSGHRTLTHQAPVKLVAKRGDDRR